MSVQGNLNAQRNKPWSDAIRRALARYDGGKENALNLIADQIVKSAVQGDVAAWKEIGDRMDGKAVQGVEHSGPEGSDIPHSVKVLLVGDTGAVPE